MSKSINPSESELEILQVLWQNGESSVRNINEKLNEQRDVGYTTTLKIIQIMFDKGYVNKNTSQRSHTFTAKVKEKDIKGSLLDKFVKNTFKGSAKELVMHALGKYDTDQEELDEIKALIANLEKQES